MNENPIINVNNLSKSYKILHNKPERYIALRDILSQAIIKLPTDLVKYFKNKQIQTKTKETFWALSDVSFSINQGERVGIIGRNGAGKSTLLKLLSRITTPTKGKIELRGRVASLLEVGTGFHPELTGRENVYLNGAILGMSRSEIRRKFDEIVAFADIEKFLDTPVKRYSSGMYVRLAFAVAAHLESEALLVDEVLAVGDAEFQKKCIYKMSEVAKGGRTILFVSHNMNAVQNLCNRGIVLNKGSIIFEGNIQKAIDTYSGATDTNNTGFSDLSVRSGYQETIINSIGLLSNTEQNTYRNVVHTGDDLSFEISYSSSKYRLSYAAIAISTILGERIITACSHHDKECPMYFPETGKIIINLPNLILSEGEYVVMIAIGTKIPIKNLDLVENALHFNVEFNNFFQTGAKLLRGQGYIAQKSDWHFFNDN